MAEAFDGSQNLVSGFGPFEGLRVSVVHVDEGADVGLELPDGCVDTSLDLLSGEFSEPALDLIDPRCGSRRKMNMIVSCPSWLASPPAAACGPFHGGSS